MMTGERIRAFSKIGRDLRDYWARLLARRRVENLNMPQTIVAFWPDDVPAGGVSIDGCVHATGHALGIMAIGFDAATLLLISDTDTITLPKTEISLALVRQHAAGRVSSEDLLKAGGQRKDCVVVVACDRGDSPNVISLPYACDDDDGIQWQDSEVSVPIMGLPGFNASLISEIGRVMNRDPETLLQDFMDDPLVPRMEPRAARIELGLGTLVILHRMGHFVRPFHPELKDLMKVEDDGGFPNEPA